jgi:hypothetical protein
MPGNRPLMSVSRTGEDFCRRVGRDTILRPISNRRLAGETARPTSIHDLGPVSVIMNKYVYISWPRPP